MICLSKASGQNRADVTVAAMRDYLITIGFESFVEVDHSLAFRHADSEVVVTLTTNEDSDLVRPADFLSIKFRLESEGLISDNAVAELNQGKLPIAS